MSELAAVEAERDHFAQVARDTFAELKVATAERDRYARAAVRADTCECPPCPGRGNDGHRMTHCAECCFGTGVEADPTCPTHGERAVQADTDDTAEFRPDDTLFPTGEYRTTSRMFLTPWKGQHG